MRKEVPVDEVRYTLGYDEAACRQENLIHTVRCGALVITLLHPNQDFIPINGRQLRRNATSLQTVITHFALEDG
jgi:hypothetical protein